MKMGSWRSRLPFGCLKVLVPTASFRSAIPAALMLPQKTMPGWLARLVPLLTHPGTPA